MKTVNPDDGVYVEMPGVMEIRYTSDYGTEYPPEDMFGKSLYDTDSDSSFYPLLCLLFRFPRPGA